MCGIAGAVGGVHPRAALYELAQAMGAAVRHRGPDGDGTWTSDTAPVALSHRRLAVLGLGPQGHQPMTSVDGRLTITFNGEIYSHAAHRDALARTGVRFRGGSDTEVLVELMARDGVVETLSQVDGMFALAVWDDSRKLLTLARDRMGEKPLYWTSTEGTFAFCSEARPLRLVPGAGKDLNSAAVARYLRRGFVTGDQTVLDGIRRLPPGTWLSVGLDGVVDGPHTWWSAADAAVAGDAAPLRSSDVPSAVDEALRAAVGQMLVADVPVGAFLSGGIDSTLVCAVAQELSSSPVRTFTVGFDEGHGTRRQAGVDESRHAAAIAAVLGTEHHELRVSAADASSALASVIGMHDEPFADPSAVPTAMLCAATRRHVTVALSGDGADELFAGYNRYRVTRGGLSRALALPRPVRHTAGAVLSAMPARAWDALGRGGSALAPRRVPSDLASKAQKLDAVLRAGPAAAHDQLASVLDPTSFLLGAPPDDAAAVSAVGLPPLRRSLLADVVTTLPDNMLVKVDRASMAVALEVRVPYLHRAVVDVAARIAPADLVSGGRSKAVLRDLVTRRVPSHLLDRPKRGFDPPLASWLRGPLRSTAEEMLSADRLTAQGVLAPEPVRVLLDQHLSGRRDHSYPLWTLLVLQAWLEDLR